MSYLFKSDPNIKYDSETVELYKLRETSDFEQFRSITNPDRNLVIKNNLPARSKIKDEKINSALNYVSLRYPFYFVLTYYAMSQFSKTLFPMGTILRRSMPISWKTYVHQRGPSVLLLVGLWYS